MFENGTFAVAACGATLAESDIGNRAGRATYIIHFNGNNNISLSRETLAPMTAILYVYNIRTVTVIIIITIIITTRDGCGRGNGSSRGESV